MSENDLTQIGEPRLSHADSFDRISVDSDLSDSGSVIHNRAENYPDLPENRPMLSSTDSVKLEFSHLSVSHPNISHLPKSNELPILSDSAISSAYSSYDQLCINGSNQEYTPSPVRYEQVDSPISTVSSSSVIPVGNMEATINSSIFSNDWTTDIAYKIISMYNELGENEPEEVKAKYDDLSVQIVAYLSSLGENSSSEWKSLRIFSNNKKLFKTYLDKYIVPKSELFTLEEFVQAMEKKYGENPQIRSLVKHEGVDCSKWVNGPFLFLATFATGAIKEVVLKALKLSPKAMRDFGIFSISRNFYKVFKLPLPMLDINAVVFACEATYAVVWKYLIKSEITGKECAELVFKSFAINACTSIGSLTGCAIGTSVAGVPGFVVGAVIGGAAGAMTPGLITSLYDVFFRKDQEVALREAYKFLQVKTNASNVTIYAAYRALLLTYHPDKNGGNDEDLKKLTTAYCLIKASREPQEGPVKSN